MHEILATLSTQIEHVDRTVCDTSWFGAYPSGNPYTRLYWVVGGEGMLLHHGRHFFLRPGALYVIPGHTAVWFRCGQQMDVYWVHFTAHVLTSLDLFTFLPCDYAVPVHDRARVQQMWHRMLSCFCLGTAARMLEVDGLLRQLLAPFLDTLEGETQRVEGLERFRRVLQYIDQHLHERITLHTLAQLLHLQPTYFSNLFSRQMGEPPLAYVNRRRIERAQTLLWHGDLPLREIAAAVGFGDEFYFSRVFHRITGLSPGAFRRQRGVRLP